MRDDIATTSPDITDLGDGVFQIDTKMAGYQGITAGYLIRSSRPCLVETGTSTSAPVVRAALASLGIEPADLATVVVTHIHLDHAVEAVRQRTLSRYATLTADADPAVAAKFELVGGTAPNVGGIWHWLDKLDLRSS